MGGRPTDMETSLKSDGYSRLKLNGRLGGSNEYVKNLSERAAPLLIMGADVAHAGPGSSLKSVASYVSMIDAECTRPFTSLREHATLHEEKLVDLEQVMRQVRRLVSLLPPTAALNGVPHT